jgi:hypothetical protein
MAKVTRRAFISTAGAVTGAAALAAAGPGLVGAAERLGSAAGGDLPDEPVVAYVRNPKAGGLAVMVGDREVAVKDRGLVQRIVKAAG